MSDSPSVTPKKMITLSNGGGAGHLNNNKGVSGNHGKASKWKSLLNSGKKEREKRISTPEISYSVTPSLLSSSQQGMSFTNQRSPNLFYSPPNAHAFKGNSLMDGLILPSFQDYSSPSSLSSNMRHTSPRFKADKQLSSPSSFGSFAASGNGDSNNHFNSANPNTAPPPVDIYKTPVNQIHSFENQYDYSNASFKNLHSGNDNAASDKYLFDADFSSSTAKTQYMTPQSNFSSPYTASHSKSKQFGFPPSSVRSKKSLVGNKCCICEESLETKFLDEKLMELVCNDNCHEECFKATIEIEISHFFSSRNSGPLDTKRLIKNKADLIEHIFPRCIICHEKVVPTDSQVIDHFITKALLSQQNQQDSAIAALNSTLRKSDKKLHIDIPHRHVGTSPSPLISSKAKKSLIESDRNCAGIFSPYQVSLEKKPSRGSSISAVSSIISSASRSRSPSPTGTISTVNTINTTSVKIRSHSRISLEVLKAKFINFLMTSCNNKLSAQAVKNFGPLRLVDKLSVSFDGSDYATRNCYLFLHYIVTFNLTYDTIKMMNLINVKISIPDPSVIQVSKANEKGDLESMYITGDFASVVEKWGVALADFRFTFPSEIFTSTIVLPEFRTNSKHFSVYKADEHSIISEASTISQSGLASNRASVQSDTSLLTFANAATYTTPIKQIIMVVNCKNYKNSKIVLKNILRALLIKYSVYLFLVSNSKKNATFELESCNVILETKFDSDFTDIDDLDPLLENKPKLKIHTDIKVLMDDYVGEKSGTNLDELGTIIISDSTIALNSRLSTRRNLMVEIGTLHANTDKTVMSCSSWDNVMESICRSDLRIDFDMDTDSDSDYDSDYDSCIEEVSERVPEEVRRADNEKQSKFEIDRSVASDIASLIKTRADDIQTTYLDPYGKLMPRVVSPSMDTNSSDEENDDSDLESSESDSDEELIINLRRSYHQITEQKKDHESGHSSATTIMGEIDGIPPFLKDSDSDFDGRNQTKLLLPSYDNAKTLSGLHISKKKECEPEFGTVFQQIPSPKEPEYKENPSKRSTGSQHLRWSTLFSDIDNALNDFADWETVSSPLNMH